MEAPFVSTASALISFYNELSNSSIPPDVVDEMVADAGRLVIQRRGLAVTIVREVGVKHDA